MPESVQGKGGWHRGEPLESVFDSWPGNGLLAFDLAIVSDGPTLRAFDASTGAGRWTFGANGQWGELAALNGQILGCLTLIDSRRETMNTEVYAINPSDGALRWRGSLAIDGCLSLAVDLSTVFVGTPSGDVDRFDFSTGVHKGRTPSGYSRVEEIVLWADQVVALRTFLISRIDVYDAATMTPLWNASFEHDLRTTIVPADGIANASFLCYMCDNRLRAFGAGGPLPWPSVGLEGARAEEGGQFPAPLVHRGRLWYPTEGGFEVVDLGSAKVMKSFDACAGERFMSSGPLVVVRCQDAEYARPSAIAIDSESLAERWRQESGIPMALTEDFVLFSSYNGIFTVDARTGEAGVKVWLARNLTLAVWVLVLAGLVAAGVLFDRFIFRPWRGRRKPPGPHKAVQGQVPGGDRLREER